MRRSRQGRRDVELARHAAQSLSLTSPTNQTSLLDAVHAAPHPELREQVFVHPDTLDKQVDRLRDEIRFASAVPIRHWIRQADVLKREADQHHTAGDLALQYVCLAKCSRILSQLIPQEHAGYAHMDPELRLRMRRNAETIARLVELSRVAILDDAQRHDSAALEHARPSTPAAPVPGTCAPQGSSLRSPGETNGRRKSVSFAAEDTVPVRRALFRKAEKKEGQKAEKRSFRDMLTRRDARDVYIDSASDAARDPGVDFPQNHARHKPRTRFFTASPLAPFSGPHAPFASSKGPGTHAPEPKCAGTHHAVAQHISTHQREQGFAPASETPSRTAALSHMLDTPQRATPSALQPTVLLHPPTASHASPLSRPQRPPGPRRSGSDRSEALLELPRTQPFGTPPAAMLQPDSAGASIKAGGPLRPLTLPSTLFSSFLGTAQENTEAERETCALLLGVEHDHTLQVTHLVLPSQSGTGHSCTAWGEEKIATVQLEQSLLTLGWIHTHPTQSCFLSSLDLHTQAGYQALLPEAVAVVCAPRKMPSVGVFQLTQPFGLQHILQCTNPAPFHSHTMGGASVPQLYTDALAGHASVVGGPVTVLDLR
ncbi:hypothetical protein MVES_002665 [Malassezia vespertilionis]|uniref:MPN domain-containing protein n=1 Tax=Malassezia vespertilionis TaxID=2020962 RepID=A0A2N1JAI1_9BASI|nr:hypothetical protein MVES_002665 [Malassezia vespertilionis]